MAAKPVPEPSKVIIPGAVVAVFSTNAFDDCPRYFTSTDRLGPAVCTSYGTTALICVALTYVRGAYTPLGRNSTCTPPMVVGTLVQGLGQLALLSWTAGIGPIGLEALAKIEMSSPGDTAPVA